MNILEKLKTKTKEYFDNFKTKARNLKKEVKALYLAYKRPDVPWYAKLMVMMVVGYALNPIDLIPDFIPVLGYLDDLVIIPLGVYLTIKLVPAGVMEECRVQAEDLFKDGKPKNWISGTIIIFVWIMLLTLIGFKIYKYFGS